DDVVHRSKACAPLGGSSLGQAFASLTLPYHQSAFVRMQEPPLRAWNCQVFSFRNSNLTMLLRLPSRWRLLYDDANEHRRIFRCSQRVRHFARHIHEVAGAHGLATAVRGDIDRALEALHRNRAVDRMLRQLLASRQNESHDLE